MKWTGFIFVPPFAGHPSIGTAYVLARRMASPIRTMRLETAAGMVAVDFEMGAGREVIGGMTTAPQPLSVGEEIPPETIASCVGLQPADIVVSAHRPLQASVGKSVHPRAGYRGGLAAMFSGYRGVSQSPGRAAAFRGAILPASLRSGRPGAACKDVRASSRHMGRSGNRQRQRAAGGALAVARYGGGCRV